MIYKLIHKLFITSRWVYFLHFSEGKEIVKLNNTACSAFTFIYLPFTVKLLYFLQGQNVKWEKIIYILSHLPSKTNEHQQKQ